MSASWSQASISYRHDWETRRHVRQIRNTPDSFRFSRSWSSGHSKVSKYKRVTTPAIKRPTHHTEDGKPHVVKRLPGAACERREVTDFFDPADGDNSQNKNKTKLEKQRTLFLRAYFAIQDRSVQQPLRCDGYLQMASIHGYPYRPFDNIDPYNYKPNPDDDEAFGGYCQHGTQQFPPWHRPYVMMIEQELWKEAKTLAEEYPENSGWVTAANELRHPYWDWALRDLPSIFWSENVTVELQDGSTLAIRNPLCSYTVSDPAYQPSTRKKHPLPDITVRHPDDSGKSNPIAFEQALSSNRIQLAQRLRCILFSPKDRNWPCFSNHYANKCVKGTPNATGNTDKWHCEGQDSLEGLHDLVHDLMGGEKGHLSNPDFAGFDPLFYFHHANVDRILAIWECLHPVEDIDPTYPERGENGAANTNFTDPSGLKASSPSSLQYPFRSSAFTFWKPKHLLMGASKRARRRTTKHLGYFYSILDEQSKSPSIADLAHKIWEMYGGKEGEEVLNLRLSNIPCKLLDKSFLVKVYLRTPQEKAQADAEEEAQKEVHKIAGFIVDDHHYAGSIGVFKRSEDTQCRNCQEQEKYEVDNVFGDVPLNDAVTRLGMGKDFLKDGTYDGRGLVLLVIEGTDQSQAMDIGSASLQIQKLLVPPEPDSWVVSIRASVARIVRRLVPWGVRQTAFLLALNRAADSEDSLKAQINLGAIKAGQPI